MPEPRFGGKPPTVIILAALSFTADEIAAGEGYVPPWVVLAGAGWLVNQSYLTNTNPLPPVTYTITATLEAEGPPPNRDRAVTLRLRAEGGFLPDQEAQVPYVWPAGAEAIPVTGSLSVPSGYAHWTWRALTGVPFNVRDGEWTVIG